MGAGFAKSFRFVQRSERASSETKSPIGDGFAVTNEERNGKWDDRVTAVNSIRFH